MSLQADILLWMAAIGYLLAAWMIWHTLSRDEHHTLPAAILSTVGLLAQGWYHLGPVFAGQPMNFAFFHALSLISGTLVLLWLLALFRPAMRSLGTVLLPYAAITAMLLAWLHDPAQVTEPQSWQLELHAAIAVLAYASLSLAAIQAVLLWLLDWLLRQPRYLPLASRLPPLEAMDKLLFRIVAVGFLLLSLTLLSGILFVDDLFAQHLVHKTVLSALAWVVFGTLLLGRVFRGWRGRVAVHWTLAGMSLLVLAYFGSKLVIELILQRT